MASSSAASSTDMATDEPFAARIKQYSRCSLVTAMTQKREVAKMACIGYDVLLELEEEMVRDAGIACLKHYSADGVPAVLHQTCRARFNGKQVARTGKGRKEFLMQVAFVRCPKADGSYFSCVLAAPPLWLNHGVDSDAIYAAGARFVRTLRQLGFRNIALNHYAFDRKGYDKLCRLHFQRHANLEKDFGRTPRRKNVLGIAEVDRVHGMLPP